MDSAIAGVQGIKLTEKQQAAVVSLAVNLAMSAIEDFLLESDPNCAELKAQDKAAEESFLAYWDKVEKKQSGDGKTIEGEI